MATSAPHSPAHRDGNSYFDTSPDRPSPSKLLRIHQLHMDRASSLPPRRLSSPAKRVPQIRPRLNQYYTLDHAVSLFKSSKNIIILTGAGISTSLGVPDFRSANGVYNLLVDSVYDDPQELFHIDNFKMDPEEFFKQAAKVFPKMQGLVPGGRAVDSSQSANDICASQVPKYSLTHAFISLLQAKGKLLTNYTQNIDGLELAAGVSPSKLIQCHGTLATATCMSCGKRTTARKYMPVVRAGGVPYCKCTLVDGGPKPRTGSKHRGRSGKKKRKRDEFEDTDSEDSAAKTDFPKGLLKPDMTFFGEDIADSYAPRLKIDKSKVDLLVIVGTSLKVEPVNEMLLNIPVTVPQIWISKDRCQREGVKVDIELLGECDLVLEEIARRAGWEEALKERLWSTGKSPNANDPLTKKTSTNKEQAKHKQSNANSPPAKSEGSLQIRPKANETGIPKAPPFRDLVVKVNDEEIATCAGTDVKQNPRQTLSENGDANVDDANKSNSRCSNGTATGHEHGNKRAEQKASQPQSPSKVIVELEEGTRSRWYIRRAK
ncbi:uncharacterized protein Z520_09755 [Fonsecaea multimorphosa CBS 102226]|uniref:Deacetylase sirtuin-type domain-containing protein n=1 Tax=Fonsecaea multimorphosa CBS 102226 TaxID=1442371 RepID=A0A0D2JV13_9EURO|nr:uncharacterized protein Z520_09755 [Fonsecaea multimorphosa CBS 102226]KIX94369.1 hypothetical protein Z520_09755 [Fonsecaea multimorphosa CBS 102226]OAL20130.1 hypothetical protein AYO22_09102 [Fonsecaea multimorphosa]